MKKVLRFLESSPKIAPQTTSVGILDKQQQGSRSVSYPQQENRQISNGNEFSLSLRTKIGRKIDDVFRRADEYFDNGFQSLELDPRIQYQNIKDSCGNHVKAFYVLSKIPEIINTIISQISKDDRIEYSSRSTQTRRLIREYVLDMIKERFFGIVQNASNITIQDIIRGVRKSPVRQMQFPIEQGWG